MEKDRMTWGFFSWQAANVVTENQQANEADGGPKSPYR